MRRIFITLIALTAACTLQAQDKLILTTGDTLTGEIEVLLPDSRYEEIIFTRDGDRTRYRSHEFVSFNADSIDYRTIKFGDKYRIMQVESDDYLSLLKFRSDESYTFNSQFLYKRSGDGIEVPNFMFKKAMSKFLDDCIPVREAIAEGSYRRNDLNALVVAYNECMDRMTKNRLAEYREAQVVAENTPLIDEFKNLKKQAEQMGDEELTSMLNDVISRLEKAETVPNYLKNALTEHVKDDHELKKATDVLVSQL